MGLISRKLLKRRPQEIGRIKIGGKGELRNKGKSNEFRLPVKFDHFVVTKHVRGSDENYIRDEQIHEHPSVGPEPTELAGLLMFDRPEDNFHSEMAIWKGRGKDSKVVTCDGETATKLTTGEQGACALASGKECACKPYGRLHIQLWASPHTLGYHVFRTTSWESVNNIQTTLEDIYERFGTCYNAPVKLVAYPSEDRHDGGTSTSLKVGLVLAVPMEDAALRMARAQEHLQIARGEVKQIAASVHEDQDARDEEDARHIADEFFPPSTGEIVQDALRAPDEEEEEDGDGVEGGIPVAAEL
jgi:hypothetical protein